MSFRENHWRGLADRRTVALRSWSPVPADRYEALLLRVRGLVPVRSASSTGRDVTAQSRDLDARIRTLTAARDRFIALLARADTVSEATGRRRVRSQRTTRRTEADVAPKRTLVIRRPAASTAPLGVVRVTGCVVGLTAAQPRVKERVHAPDG